MLSDTWQKFVQCSWTSAQQQHHSAMPNCAVLFKCLNQLWVLQHWWCTLSWLLRYCTCQLHGHWCNAFLERAQKFGFTDILRSAENWLEKADARLFRRFINSAMLIAVTLFYLATINLISYALEKEVTHFPFHTVHITCIRNQFFPVA